MSLKTNTAKHSRKTSRGQEPAEQNRHEARHRKNEPSLPKLLGKAAILAFATTLSAYAVAEHLKPRPDLAASSQASIANQVGMLADYAYVAYTANSTDVREGDWDSGKSIRVSSPLIGGGKAEIKIQSTDTEVSDGIIFPDRNNIQRISLDQTLKNGTAIDTIYSFKNGEWQVIRKVSKNGSGSQISLSNVRGKTVTQISEVPAAGPEKVLLATANPAAAKTLAEQIGEDAFDTATILGNSAVLGVTPPSSASGTLPSSPA